MYVLDGEGKGANRNVKVSHHRPDKIVRQGSSVSKRNSCLQEVAYRREVEMHRCEAVKGRRGDTTKNSYGARSGGGTSKSRTKETRREEGVLGTTKHYPKNMSDGRVQPMRTG